MQTTEATRRPDAIAKLLTEAIERYVDLGVIERIHQEQEQERLLLKRAAADAKLSLRYHQLISSRQGRYSLVTAVTASGHVTEWSERALNRQL